MSKMSLALASILLTTAACAVETTSTENFAILETPCAADADCPSGFECEIEVEHGTTTSFCQADDVDTDCPAGFELEVEHGQAFCKPHGGADDGTADDGTADDSGGGSGGGADDGTADDRGGGGGGGADDPAPDARIAQSGLEASMAVAADVAAKAVDVKGTASCTGGVVAKFKAGPRDPGQVKSNVQIDDVAVGNAWRIRVIDGAEVVVKSRTTAGASGTINVDFFTTDNAGPEHLRFRARRVDGSALCIGTVNLP